jgi:hypothetical protein
MFPDPCGAIFAEAVRNGADPKTVVPDTYFVVHGGTAPIPDAGTALSAAVGPTLESAAAAVPHGQIRIATAGAIRRQGGEVEWIPEMTRYGILNVQHVNVLEAGAPSSFSELQPNPVPRRMRIGGAMPRQ